MEMLKRFWKEEEGQDLIEYALLAGFIIVVTAATLLTIGQSVSTIYSKVNTNVSTAAAQ